jgi:FMN phosphatase YigB (HAD superfamily)
VPPGQISFADDSVGNVKAALACGWNAATIARPATWALQPANLPPT